MVNLWLFVAVSAGGAVAGCLYLLLGGAGVARALKKRCMQLEIDVDDLRDQIAREVKRRAAWAAGQAREEKKSFKDMQIEAERRLAEAPKTPSVPTPPGFPTMFNRG